MAYKSAFELERYVGVDIDPNVVKANKKRGIECILGDALDQSAVHQIANSELIFFGPPLSVRCAGHQIFKFGEVKPGFVEFANLLYRECGFEGALVCIGSNRTTMSDIQWFYDQIKKRKPDIGLRLIHHSYSTVTGRGDNTDMRLKYVELWLSPKFEDSWEYVESKENIGPP